MRRGLPRALAPRYRTRALPPLGWGRGPATALVTADEILRFVEFWKRVHGAPPKHLVFNSKLTVQRNLGVVDGMGITFLTLRARTTALNREVVLLPASSWRTVELDVPTRRFRFPQIFEPKVSIADCELRQFFIKDLGHEDPTILLTNDRKTNPSPFAVRLHSSPTLAL